MDSKEPGKVRRRRANDEAPEKERPERAPQVEHDQDSEPPRTARAPGSEDIDEEWGRQEGC